ncbi:MAG: DUF4384 domain-containing protein [Muribaculaceae bacterium]|nr:DUF4384 domain-containing protein [Muribaculaceae bacterium]
MKLRIFTTLSVLLCLNSLIAHGAGAVREISGEYTYYDDGRKSRVEIMEIAATQARLEALAREYGTLLTQTIQQNDIVKNGRETNDFLALSSTEVKGEWLGDTQEPKYEFSMDANQNLIVTCKVRGRAREISNEAVDFEAIVLRNGTKRANSGNEFRNGDELFLLFNPSSDGYISVYLEDEHRQVHELLPYPRDTKSELKLKRGEDYVFFSEKLGGGKYGPEEELIMTAEDEREYNRLYVIFSPNPYSRPVTRNSGGLNSTTSSEFTKWLLKTRQKDNKMGVHTMLLTITE